MAFPVLLVLLIGVLVNRIQLVSRKGIDEIKNIVVSVTLPAVLIKAFSTAEYTLQSIVIPLFVFASCIVALLLGKLGGKALHLSSPFVGYLTTGFEAGMLGYALYEMLFGAENTANFAIVDLGQVLFVFTVYKILLGNMKKDVGGRKLSAVLIDMVKSPIIIAIAVGILIGATGLYDLLIPSGISPLFIKTMEFIAAPTSVLILIVVGYDLSIRGVKWAMVGKTILLRLVIMIALMFALVFALDNMIGLTREMKGAMYLMFLLPPPYVLPAFADNENERGNISSVLSVYTIVSIAAFFVLSALGI